MTDALAEIRKLRREIQTLRQRISVLESAAAPIDLREGISNTLGFRLYNPDTTSEPTFFLYMGSDDTDLSGNPTGAAILGGVWDVNNQNWWAHVKDAAALGMWEAGSFKYLILAYFDQIKYAVPTRLAQLSSDPSGMDDGAQYYNSTTNKGRIKENGSWRDI